ncbi:dihydrofolate reductase family protein [Phaeovulum sp.]|uniref:dihydrofolate reductase family protein n=1 Tax=Phaeovulum sp. TaxID=2934796 RepID=UPI00272F79A9|nr:dihydrofolate reductase family protein [Phaeovulum sp.]MDP1669331.1 dihydrofolate reductase family protein [Phaeovulum sp.]MDZ4119607.1 dihydrofolate reductase family protein [Phaeovulum sp.]
MASIRGMMAASLDGFAADASGGVGWLAPFEAVDWGYAGFLAEIGTVVMGRRTYAQALELSAEWPYPGKRAIVVSRTLSQPLAGGAELWSGGLPALAAHLGAAGGGDVWVVGGPMLQSALIGLGALDRLELAVVPRLLGAGVPAFARGARPGRQPRLAGLRQLPLGMVMLDYRFGEPGRGGRAL